MADTIYADGRLVINATPSASGSSMDGIYAAGRLVINAVPDTGVDVIYAGGRIVINATPSADVMDVIYANGRIVINDSAGGHIAIGADGRLVINEECEAEGTGARTQSVTSVPDNDGTKEDGSSLLW